MYVTLEIKLQMEHCMPVINRVQLYVDFNIDLDNNVDFNIDLDNSTQRQLIEEN